MEISRNPENGKFRFASMTESEYLELSEDGGLCLGCDNTQTPVEPDAVRIVCESCFKPFVYGIAQLLLMGRIRFTAEASAEDRVLG
jgi:hypothetical protein